MNINFNGYKENILTFLKDENLSENGVPVKLISDGTVTSCKSNDIFCGICVAYRGQYAAVQLEGYVRMATSSRIGVGYKKLVADGNGGVKESNSGIKYLVTDSTETEVGFIL